MKVVVTGGTGFLGLRLARAILERGTLYGASAAPESINKMILFDVVTPPERPQGLDERVEIVSGDISDRNLVMRLISGDSLSVFHFASVVSAGAEQDFALALKVNLDGGLVCRASFLPRASPCSAARPCPTPSRTTPRSRR